MRKSANRKRKAVVPPMMVVSYVKPEYEIRQYQALTAIQNGYAEGQHYRDLADLTDILIVAHSSTPASKPYPQILEEASKALISIHQRYKRLGKYGVTAKELVTLRKVVDFSVKYWPRQSGDFFAKCNEALKRLRQENLECSDLPPSTTC